jgi:hypothetical protein
VPEEGSKLVLEVREGVEVVEEDREHPFDDDTVGAEFDASRQCGLDPMRPRHDGGIVSTVVQRSLDTITTTIRTIPRFMCSKIEGRRMRLRGRWKWLRAIDGPQIDFPACPAGWAGATAFPAIRAARIVGDHSMSWPVASRRPPSIEASRVRELKAQGMRPSDIAKKICRASLYGLLGQEPAN